MISFRMGLPRLVTVFAVTILSIASVDAGEIEDRGPIACMDSDPTSCLNRHGNDVSATLSKAYADFSKKLNTACFDVIGAGIADCLKRSQDEADKELATAYADAMAATESGKEGDLWRTQLMQSQEAWLSFREADCGDLISSEYYNGTGQGNASQICYLGQTKIRAQELNRRYKR